MKIVSLLITTILIISILKNSLSQEKTITYLQDPGSLLLKK